METELYMKPFCWLWLIVFVITGCGGYGHINGQKVTDIVHADLLKMGHCQSKADCSRQQLVEWGEGINSLHLRVKANLNTEEIGTIVSHVITQSPPGSIDIEFYSTPDTKNYSVKLQSFQK
jgi:hypothetical protein